MAILEEQSEIFWPYHDGACFQLYFSLNDVDKFVVYALFARSRLDKNSEESKKRVEDFRKKLIKKYEQQNVLVKKAYFEPNPQSVEALDFLNKKYVFEY